MTCRRVVLVTGASVRSVWQSGHTGGSTTTVSSGSFWGNVEPGSPFALPGLRPGLSRNERFLFLGGLVNGSSEDGGLEEFEESLLSRLASSSTCAVSLAICPACAVSWASLAVSSSLKATRRAS